MASNKDSKVTIDTVVAEKLKGKGNMLLKYKKSYIHIQGIYIDKGMVEELCDYIKENRLPPYLVSLKELKKRKILSPKSGMKRREVLVNITKLKEIMDI